MYCPYVCKINKYTIYLSKKRNKIIRLKIQLIQIKVSTDNFSTIKIAYRSYYAIIIELCVKKKRTAHVIAKSKMFFISFMAIVSLFLSF